MSGAHFHRNQPIDKAIFWGGMTISAGLLVLVLMWGCAVTPRHRPVHHKTHVRHTKALTVEHGGKLYTLP